MFGWATASVMFLMGIWSRLPTEEPTVDAIVILCIAFAQTLSLSQLIRRPCIRSAVVSCAILFWALGFSARGFELIGDALYAGNVAIFVGMVVFLRTRRATPTAEGS